MSINPIKSNLNTQTNHPIKDPAPSSTNAAPSLAATSKQIFRDTFKSTKINIEEEKNRILQNFIPLESNAVSEGINPNHAIPLLHADLLFLRFLKDNKTLCTKHTGPLIQLIALITVIKYDHDYLFKLSEAQPASISLDRLKRMELLFLNCIDWNIGVSSLEDLNKEREQIQLSLKRKN